LNLEDFQDLTHLNVQECSAVSKIVCANNPDNPIELQSNSLENCSNLSELYGNFIILGDKVFAGCSSLRLALDKTKGFIEGPNATNIQFAPNLASCYNLF
jgi:hypothetical protein